MTHWISNMIGKFSKMDLVDRTEILNKLLEMGAIEKEDKEETYTIINEAAIAVFKAQRVDPVEIVEVYERNGNFEV